MKLLPWLNNEYEKILHSGLSDSQKDEEYENIMSEMEHIYKIPMIRNKEWEKENRKVIALYRKIATSRKL